MGHVVAMDGSEALLELTAHSRRLWTELSSELPPDVEDERRGTVWIARDAHEMDAALAKAHAYRRAGIDAGILSADELHRLEPNLVPGLAGGLLVPEDRVLYPPTATRWLLDAAVKNGATREFGHAVREIRAAGVELKGARIDAAVTINAAGPEAPRLSPGLPIVPRKGHLAITDRVPGFCRHQLVELGYTKSAHEKTGSSVAFNVQPRATGQLLIGSSRELVGWNAEMNPEILGRMLQRSLQYMPTLARVPVLRTWTGFRPATPDGLPLIGRLAAPEDSVESGGVFVAAGHEGLGITAALATGALIADLVRGTAPGFDPRPFDPNRKMPPANTGAEH